MQNLIFLDIDGTILDASRGMPDISQKTRYAVKQLQENGDYVIISSGRCKGLLNKQVTDLNSSGYVLCNGAYGEIEGKQIYAISFRPEAISKIKEAVRIRNGFYILETLDEMFVNSLELDAFRRFAEGWGLCINSFSERRVDGPYYIAMIGFTDFSYFEGLEEELGEYADLAPHNGFCSLDVNVKGVNKGVGVKKLIEYMNIPKENTYCFGDGMNDLEMLKEVGHPVTMGNCDKALDVYGFEKTADVLNDGVYDYLVKHKLIKAL